MLAQGLKAVCAGVATVTGLKLSEKFGPDLSKKILRAKDDYKWDFNWDKRHPQENWTDDEKLKFTSKHTRRLYMIRHGQYEDGEKDADRCLSVKGRQQAKLCGEFLKSHVFNKEDKQPTTFVHSTMLRATETAQIINEVLQVPCKVESCDLIREGCPCEPEPPLKNWPGKPWLEWKEEPRIEAGFRRHVRRAKPDAKGTEHAVVVCHGNVIRYFLCRGLQLPPTAWLHMTLPHCSVSYLHCRPSGTVGTIGIGECSFLPAELVTVTNEKKSQ